MFFFISFFIFFIYFLLKLYYLVDKLIIFSSNGTKLKKYISRNNLQSMNCNFEESKNNTFLSKFFIIINTPGWYKNIIGKILVSVTISVIYLAVTYKYIFSNFLYVNIFGKSICLNNLFLNNFIYVKHIYILLLYYFIYSNISNFYNKILNFISKRKSIDLSKIQEEKIRYNLGFCDKESIYISELGLYQNLLITGSIGSGKTSSAISNCLDMLIKNKLGGLIIDVKGNFINTVNKICNKYNMNQNLKVLSLKSNFCYNPLDRENISAQELSSRIKLVLELVSPSSKNSDSYWLDKAQEYIKDFIIIIREYKDFPSFYEIQKLVLDKNYLFERIDELKDKMLSGVYNDSKLYELKNAIFTIKEEYLKLDDRTVGIIKSEITRITSPFTSSMESIEKFCGKNTFKLDGLNINLLSINIGENKDLAKFVATYIKLEFQKEVLSNRYNMPVFFICDEYQEYANKEDANFFSISREYKCINIVSMQSYSSLLNNLQDEYSLRVVIQNFVNKIWFRNDDTYTISEIIKQIGKEKRQYKTLSVSEGGQDSKYSIMLKKFKNIKSSLSHSYSLSEKDEYVLNEEYFSLKLKTFEAACVISDGYNMKFIKRVKFKRWDG